ncbi:BLUF domain-containing protein [Arthrobacter cheniae]|uniref:BLUF domain-containing protein n=1 Tax=Arthrobacter cheniae TaxID=1258888 RepID=A0A3A5M8F4_9MICC|nr:BLUF domain-containing protein [Arthrobacter cheniae]
MLSIVYTSTAVDLFTEADLIALLTTSRRNNAETLVTGMLLYREGRFLQVLEGPAMSVRERMSAIIEDTRHRAIRILVEDTAEQRQFPDWTMAYESISPIMSHELSDEVPGYERTFADADSDPDPARTIRTLQKLIRWFQERAIPLR